MDVVVVVMKRALIRLAVLIGVSALWSWTATPRRLPRWRPIGTSPESRHNSSLTTWRSQRVRHRCRRSLPVTFIGSRPLSPERSSRPWSTGTPSGRRRPPFGSGHGREHRERRAPRVHSDRRHRKHGVAAGRPNEVGRLLASAAGATRVCLMREPADLVYVEELSMTGRGGRIAASSISEAEILVGVTLSGPSSSEPAPSSVPSTQPLPG